ncbi:oleate hydratase [Rickettsiales bacterium]|nr:oleate hydratase [Rickettsiales bacterium]
MSNCKKTYIIGAGISGLSSACYGVKNRHNIEIFEGSNNAGGRCRSYHDKSLNIEVDNGNHLILSANNNFLEICQLIKSSNTIESFGPIFNFYDLKKKKNWSLEISNKYFPFWILSKKKRIPDTNLKDYLSLFKIFNVNINHSVSDLFLQSGNLYKSFWEPLTLGILNTECKTASAFLLSNVIKKSFLKGKDFCQIIQPKNNWNETLIKPIIEFLKIHGVLIKYKRILKNIEVNNGLITKLNFNNKEIKINKEDRVVICLPPNSLGKIMPQIQLPQQFNTILNIHFKIHKDVINNLKIPILGMLNSITHWIFLKKNYISITISSANKYNDISSEKIAEMVWHEISLALGLSGLKIPDFKVLREKKATYEQSPKNYKVIQKISKLPSNLRLAGDWTEKNLPSTIESSILSGKNSILK